MIDWLIIGGGIHGTFFSNLLVHQAGVDRDSVRVLDPHKTPLAVWNRNTRNCGMDYLRSPATHNIDHHILSLYRYAKKRSMGGKPDFIPLYNRPSLELFQKHCEHVISQRHLAELRIKGRAEALVRIGPGIGVETSAGRFFARNILLAIGLGEQPFWPEWARRIATEGAAVQHVFDPGFNRKSTLKGRRIVVVGGGITAIQTALKLAQESPVQLVTRHALRESPYDFDPCWIGPKCLRGFLKSDLAHRRRSIHKARIIGSAPSEVLRELRSALEQNRLQLHTGQIRKAFRSGDSIRLHTTAKIAEADQVVLATGFRPDRPGGGFIDQVIREFGLKTGKCGYPIVGNDLRWNENIFVTGPLAELQLGPCARNIVGARNAGRYLLKGLRNY